jgi:hypothetical protein
LQPEEIVVGFQIGIGFGNSEQSAQRAAQLAFSLDAIGGHRRGSGLRAGVDDCLKRPFFVGGVALDRVDEIWDKIVPALELDIDLRPRTFNLLPQPHQIIIDANGDRGANHNQNHKDDKDGDKYCHVQRLTETGVEGDYKMRLKLEVVFTPASLEERGLEGCAKSSWQKFGRQTVKIFCQLHFSN